MLSLTVKHIVAATHNSKTIFLATADGTPLQYQPGQFITLLLNINQKNYRRSYSLCTVPGIDEVAAITIKRVDNGIVSRHLLQHLQTGQVLLAQPATGRFTLHTQTARTVFIAAGSGITPVYALLKQLLYTTTQHAHLVYQNHTEADAIFRKELLLLQQQFTGRLQIDWLFSSPQATGGQPWRLNNYLLLQLLGNTLPHSNTYYYLCGPPLFMLMAAFTLRTGGVPATHILKEHFAVGNPPPPVAQGPVTPQQVTAHLLGTTYSFTVAWPQNILAAALSQHIPLPYSCRGGRCSACMAQCVSGTVAVADNEVLTGADEKAGLVLTCVGYAQTDVVLNFDNL